jgi:DNA-directed RNA polymerase subunit L
MAVSEAAAASAASSTSQSALRRLPAGSVYGSLVSAIDVTDFDDTAGTLGFTISNVNVSVANGIRRTILSDIPCVGFKTGTYEESQVEVVKNTCRLNNEILKQRLACIPIHITDLTVPLENLEVIIAKKNETKENMYVTTEDFKIRNVKTGAFLDDSERNAIFPPDPLTGEYILFTRLRPRISDEIPGEEIMIRAKMSITTAGEDGAANVASTCAYSFVVDEKKQAAAWALKERELAAQDYGEEEIEYERTNWLTLDGRRFIHDDRFDFQVESVGVFSNNAIVRSACDVLADKLAYIERLSLNDRLKIDSANLVDTGYDITLENEDYTIGKIIEYGLNALYYSVADSERRIAFVGFRKRHPHDTDSIIRVVLNYKVLGLVEEGQSQRDSDVNEVRNMIGHACRLGAEMIVNIKRNFD